MSKAKDVALSPSGSFVPNVVAPPHQPSPGGTETFSSAAPAARAASAITVTISFFMALDAQCGVVVGDVVDADPHLLEVDIDDAPGLDVLPVAAGEVGNRDRLRSAPHGLLGQLAEAARRREVVDVHVQRFAVLQAPDPAEVHDEVHAAVSADLRRDRGDVAPHRVHVPPSDVVHLILFEPGVRLMVVAPVLERAHQRIVAHDALRAADEAGAAVGTRRAHIVLHHDGPAVHGLDERSVHVAHISGTVLLARIGVDENLLAEVFVVDVVGSVLQRDEEVHAVAAVDAERLAERDEPVGRIAVPLVRHVLAVAPHPFAAALAVVADRAEDSPEVVDVRALDMSDLAEHPETGKIELQKLDFAVDAVLELHAGDLQALGRLHELPAFVRRERGGHLDERDLSAVERAERHRLVERPRRRAVDDVAVPEIAEVLVGLVADVGLWDGTVLAVRQPLEVRIDAGRIPIADRDDIDAGDHGDAMDRGGAARADADEGDLDLPARQPAVGEALHRAARAEAEAVQLAAGEHRRSAHPGSPPEKPASGDRVLHVLLLSRWTLVSFVLRSTCALLMRCMILKLHGTGTATRHRICQIRIVRGASDILRSDGSTSPGRNGLEGSSGENDGTGLPLISFG